MDFLSLSKDLCCAEKDAYYRFKNLEIIPWRRLLLNFVRRFIFIVEKKGQAETQAKRCLIIDDSLLHKTGKAIEFVGKLWDHVDHGYKLGLRLLLLCYYDGKSNLPLDFSLHKSKAGPIESSGSESIRAQDSPPTCFIHVRWAVPVGSIIALIKSPAKRFEPMQSAATQIAPVRTESSTVVIAQVGAAVSALCDSAQTADQVELFSVPGSPLSLV